MIVVLLSAIIFSPLVPVSKAFAFEPGDIPQNAEDFEVLNSDGTRQNQLNDEIDASLGIGGERGGGLYQGSTNAGAAGASPMAKSQLKNIKTKSCIGGIGLLFTLNLDACLAWGVYWTIMFPISWFLWLAGKILDVSMYFTLNMSKLLDNVPVVDIGWKIFRDLANIFFIFILLWIAIGIILGINSGKNKEILVHLIAVALLMNFSLFITKAVIDASNIVALHFYGLILGTDDPTVWSVTHSFSGAFMDGLQIQTLYDASANPGVLQSFSNGLVGASVNFAKIFLVGLLGSALMLVAAYVFIVAAVLMLVRVIVLMFVMLLSPLAFLAFILPGTAHHASKWRDLLFKQSFFAPAYLALSYVVVKTIQNPAFQKGVLDIPTAGQTFANITNGTDGAIALVVNFLMLIGLMLGCILIAHEMGAKGLELAKATGAAAARWAARGRYITTAGGIAGYGAQAAGWTAKKFSFGGRIAGLKQLGDKMSGFGKRVNVGAEKLQRKIDVNELDKKFQRSTFGATAVGDWIREKTTGGKMFGTKAKFGGEKSVKEAYEEDEKLYSRRYAIENMETAEQGSARLKITEGNLLAEKPDWQDKKYKNEKGEFDRAKFDEDYMKYLYTSKPEMAAYEPNRYAKTYKNPDGTFNQALFDKDTAAGKVETNKKYKKADGTFNQAAFDLDVKAGEDEFKEATKMFEVMVARRPDRSKFSADSTGDALFAAAQEKHEKEFEKGPDEKDYRNRPTSYRQAKKIYDDREKKRSEREKGVEAQRAALGSALNRVTPEEFSNMSERRIKEMVRYANLRQLKAVAASKNWTVPEINEMLGGRWETEIKEFRDFSDNVIKPYKEALDKLYNAMVSNTLQVDETGNIQEKRDDGTDQIIVDPSDGKKYVLLSKENPDGSRTQLKNPDGTEQKMELPTEPELPGRMKAWARNKMTKEEYELASLVKPELFDNEDLVHVIRWGLTNKEFRTDENMDFNLRDRMTYMKDSELDTVVEKANHPNYIAEDSIETREAAFKAASKAAEAARVAGKSEAEVEKMFRKIYARGTANDTIRRRISVGWADGRAPNEIAGARGRNRNSKAVHSVVNAGIFQNYRDKDSEDIKLLLADVLADYRDEQEEKGLVSDANRDLIKFLFTDPQSKTIAKPIEKLDADLQQVYRKLEAEGQYSRSNKISFKSDEWRNVAKKTP